MLLLLQVEEELKSTCKRKSLQLQEMGRRERLLKSDVDRVQGQVGEMDGMFLWCFSHGEGHLWKADCEFWEGSTEH